MEQIFLEPNEEITSVIDKLSTASSGKVAVVVPKNSTLFQSLVNLKLLAKQAKELNREVVLITGNKVGQRLANQVGIETYASLGTVKAPPSVAAPLTPPVEATVPVETLPDGTPIRRYVPPAGQTAPPEPVVQSEQRAEPTAATPEATTLSVEDSPLSTAAPVTLSADEPEAPGEPTLASVPSAAVSPELPTIVTRSSAPRREFHFQLPWKSLLAAGVILLLAFGVTYVLLPKATVTVTLPAKAVSETLDLAVRTVADQNENSITGNLLSVEKSLTKPIAATGKKDIGTKATGSVAFKNCEDSQAHSIPAGSKVTSSGKTFTTNSALTIPAGSFSGGGTVCNSSSVSVTVTAEVAGEAHNISNGTFTITGQSSRISGTGSTTGGTTKQVTVLTQEDVDKGLADLEKQATEEATNELTTKAEGQTIIAGAITQVAKTRSADKKVGDQVDGATVTLVTTVSAIVFDSAHAEAKLNEAMTKKIDAGQRLEIPSEQVPTLTFKEYSADKTVMTITIAGSGYGVTDVSKKELATTVRHASRAQTESRLKDKYQATDVKTEISPSWWFDRLPLLSGAISVEYGFSELVEEVPTVSP